jgi:hypothetical protein
MRCNSSFALEDMERPLGHHLDLSFFLSAGPGQNGQRELRPRPQADPHHPHTCLFLDALTLANPAQVSLGTVTWPRS